MAKKETNAKYKCVKACTLHVQTKDGSVEKLFIPYDEEMLDEKNMCIEVPAGTVVPQHFMPLNEQAEEDVEEQMSNPAKYCRTERELTLIAERMVKAGWFRDKKDDKGKVVKWAYQVAMDSIRDDMGEAASEIAAEGQDVEREAAIRELLKRGSDAKEQRKVVGDILKGAGVKFFRGAEPEALAGMVYDEGLYQAV